MVSEGMGKGFSAALTQEIEERTGVETRLAVLAHVQRGGSPSCIDRTIAARMGARAVDQLLLGRYNEVVCYTRGNIHVSEMEYAFTFDRIVKGKATEEEIAAIEPGLRSEMLERAASKKDYLNRLYNLAATISL
jgi:6-phosphofructokinase